MPPTTPDFQSFLSAAIQANFPVLQNFVRLHPHLVNKQDEISQNTALHLICEHKQASPTYFQCIRLLLDHGAKISHLPNQRGLSPFHMALTPVNHNVLRLFLSLNCADVEEMVRGNAPLSIAAGSGFLNIVRILVEEAGANLDSVDENWKCEKPFKRFEALTAFQHACVERNLDVARYLWEQGANVEQWVHGKVPLLHYCMLREQRSMRVCQFLVLEVGLDPLAQWEGKNTLQLFGFRNVPEGIYRFLINYCGMLREKRIFERALKRFMAESREAAVFFNYFVDKDRDGYPIAPTTPENPLPWSNFQNMCGSLITSIKENNVALLRRNLGKHSNLKEFPIALSNFAITPICLATQLRRFECMEILIEHQCEVDFRHGMNPLLCAGYMGYESGFELLVSKAGANVNLTLHEGHSLLYRAIFCGYTQCVSLLLAHNADPNVVEEPTKRTVYHAVSHSNKPGILKQLMVCDTCELDLDTLDIGGLTPVWLAVCNNSTRVLAELLAEGCDPDAFSQKGHVYAIHMASQRGHTKALRLLVLAEAVVNVETDEKQTALHLAVKNSHLACVALLLESAERQNLKLVDQKDTEGRTAQDFVSCPHISGLFEFFRDKERTVGTCAQCEETKPLVLSNTATCIDCLINAAIEREDEKSQLDLESLMSRNIESDLPEM